MTDWLLSILHFLLAFALVAILAAQCALVRLGMTASGLRLAANLDRVYGATAGLLLGVGFARVFYGAKSPSIYLSNPLFWTKIGLFTTVALISILPTVQLIRWTRPTCLQERFLPPDDDIRRVQWWLRAEMIVLFFIPFVAAAMARGYGLS